MTQTARLNLPATPAKLQYQNFVVIRVVAALCIILFHCLPPSHPLRPYGYVGVVLFLLISTTLMGLRASQQSLWDYSLRRGKQILRPWLFWTVIYSLFVLVFGPQVLPLEGGAAAKILAYSLGGSAIHLWYLPFIFLVSLLVWGLRRLSLVQVNLEEQNSATAKLQRIWRISLIGLGAGTICLNVNGVFNHPMGWPWEQWLTSLPAVFLGLAIASCLQLSPQSSRRWIVAICVAVLLACCWLWGQAGRDVSYRYIAAYGIGVPLLCISFGFKDQACPPWLESLSSVTLGVYLVHYAVLWVAYAVVPESLGSTGLLLTTILGSFGLAFVMPKLPIVRYFV